MKFFVAFLAIIVWVSAEEYTVKTADEIQAVKKECFEAHPLTEDQISQMKNFVFPNEEAVRQYLLCTSMKMDVYCPHEGYHADRVAKQFKMDMNEEEVKKMAEDCISKHPKGENANDVHVYEVQSCFMETEVGQKLKVAIKKRQEEHAKHA